MEFSGRLAAFPIGDILQWAQNDRRTGALVVRRSGSEKRIFLRDGAIVACFSDDPAEFFGQHLLVNGQLQEPALIRALTHCQKSGQRLGAALVELGLLGADEVEAALRQQIEDQVCDIFVWRSGIFYFAAEALPAEQELREPIAAVAVAMEGSRWADEFQRIRRVFVHDNIVLQKGRKAPQGLLTPLERRIFRLVDGHLTLAELYNEVRGSYCRFLQAAYRLAVVEALDIGVVGDHADSVSTELRLADLLIEQVTEEESVLLRRQLAVPFDVLERFVPLRVRAIPADELQRMGPELRELQAQIDGARTLGDLLGAASGDEQVRRMDWILLQLRKGSLALLPAAVEELEREVPEGGRWWRRLIPGRN
ncbi:MAG: DUF4388 domain-containing protein [Thermoanaerobaculia bacterium]